MHVQKKFKIRIKWNNKKYIVQCTAQKTRKKIMNKMKWKISYHKNEYSELIQLIPTDYRQKTFNITDR